MHRTAQSTSEIAQASRARETRTSPLRRVAGGGAAWLGGAIWLLIGTLPGQTTVGVAADREPAVAAAAPAVELGRCAEIRGVLLDILGDTTAPAGLRGEAALLIGCVADAGDAARLRALTDTREAGLRRAAVLSLGLLGAPGAGTSLGHLFDEGDPRGTDRLAAALGLALLPADQLAPALDDYLAQLPGANHGRELNTVLTLLVGWTAHPQTHRVAVIEHLVIDPSFRDPAVGALALRALRGLPGAARQLPWADLLRGDEPMQVMAALQTLADVRAPLDDTAEAELRRLVNRGRPAALRGRALRTALTLRRPYALGAAEAALAHRDPRLAAAAVAVAVQLGGGSLREAAADRLLRSRDAEFWTTALTDWRGRLPDALAAQLAAGLEGRAGFRWPEQLQTRAAILLHGHAGAPDRVRERARQHLDDLLELTIDPEVATAAARALWRPDLEEAADPLRAWFEPTAVVNLPRLPARLVALLRCGHPRATEFGRAVLADDRLSSGERTALLRAWRCLLLPRLDEFAVQHAPQAVRELLGST